MGFERGAARAAPLFPGFAAGKNKTSRLAGEYYYVSGRVGRSGLYLPER